MTSCYSITILSINKKYYFTLDTATNLITGIYDYDNIGVNIKGPDGLLPLPNFQYIPDYIYVPGTTHPHDAHLLNSSSEF